jgi:hypothetical protein
VRKLRNSLTQETQKNSNDNSKSATNPNLGNQIQKMKSKTIIVAKTE